MDVPTTTSKDQRLALRLSRPQRAVIEEAALLRGESLTDFSVTAAVSRAEEVLAERRTWVLSPEDWERFVDAIDHPARALPGLADLARRRSLFE